MTLERAIEILELDKNCSFEDDADELEKAIQLGIEALKRELWNRLHPSYPEKGVLPGETEV